MRNRMTTVAALALIASGCQIEALRPIQLGSDTREFWMYMPPHEGGRGGMYRCYDNAGKPQCVEVVLTNALTPSPGFCATHPQ